MPPELKRYDGLLLSPNVATQQTVQALLMTEGKVTDRDEEYTVEQLEAIATATNEYLATGEDTPLFLSNHNEDGEYRTSNITGALQSGLAVSEITEGNLPHPGMTDLIGKSGLFGTINITMDSGLKAYSGGIKKISVGIGGDDVIYEVSMVPWGAIRGASLYSKNFTPTKTRAGNLLLSDLSDEDKEAIATYGLTIAQTQREGDVEESMWDEFRLLTTTIQDIQSADESSLQGRTRQSLIEQSITDFAQSLRSRLLPSPDPLLPPLPTSTFTKEQSMPPEETPLETTSANPELEAYKKEVDTKFSSMEQRLEAETQRANSLEKRQQVTTTYTRLRNQGESLIRQYKLTPAQYKATFSDNPEADIDNFLNPPEGEEAKYSLSNIEYHFNNLEQYGQAIAPTANTGGQPQEIDDPAQEKYDEELATYRKSRGHVTKEAG